MSNQPYILEKAEQAHLDYAPATTNAVAVDRAAESKLVRRIDLVVTPMFFLVYLITFIVRLIPLSSLFTADMMASSGPRQRRERQSCRA
jgi:hypothetical protein